MPYTTSIAADQHLIAFHKWANEVTATPTDDTLYEITGEYAEEPTMNTQHFEEGLGGLPSYLRAIIEAPDFHSIQYSIGTTRKTIRKVE